MRIGLRKLNEEKLVIEPEEKRSKQEEFTKETTKKLTISDTIGLGLLTVFLLGLSQCMRIELGNQRDPNIPK